MCVARFMNTYQERIKQKLDYLGAAGLETPGFAKELSNKKTGHLLATQWRGNKSANTGSITDLADLRKPEKLYRDYSRCISWVPAGFSFTRKFCSVIGSTPNVFIFMVSPHHT